MGCAKSFMAEANPAVQVSARPSRFRLARSWMMTPDWETSQGSIATGDAFALVTIEARATVMTLRTREAAAPTRAALLIALKACLPAIG